jgi:hypothetical protein
MIHATGRPSRPVPTLCEDRFLDWLQMGANCRFSKYGSQARTLEPSIKLPSQYLAAYLPTPHRCLLPQVSKGRLREDLRPRHESNRDPANTAQHRSPNRCVPRGHPDDTPGTPGPGIGSNNNHTCTAPPPAVGQTLSQGRGASPPRGREPG